MKLNLVNSSLSDIHFQVHKFPDGQQNITLGNFVHNGHVQILSRLNNFKDLELILCATAALKGSGVKNVSLYTPCFIGQRSDRKFEVGGSHYLKDVICPIINAQGYTEVKVHTPHSDVLEALLTNFKAVSQNSLLYQAYLDIFSQNPNVSIEDDYYIVSPDAGALKRTYSANKSLDRPLEVLACSKYRNPITGDIEGTEVPDHSPRSVYIILDDLIDGGRTFLDLAKEIKNHSPNCSIYLIATHGVFSKGFEPFYENFSRVYCTNSFSDTYTEWDKNGSGKHPRILKTFDIFK